MSAEQKAEQAAYEVLTALGRNQVLTLELEAARRIIARVIMEAEDAAFDKAATKLARGVKMRVRGQDRRVCFDKASFVVASMKSKEA